MQRFTINYGEACVTISMMQRFTVNYGEACVTILGRYLLDLKLTVEKFSYSIAKMKYIKPDKKHCKLNCYTNIKKKVGIQCTNLCWSSAFP